MAVWTLDDCIWQTEIEATDTRDVRAALVEMWDHLLAGVEPLPSDSWDVFLVAMGDQADLLVGPHKLDLPFRYPRTLDEDLPDSHFLGVPGSVGC